MKRESSSPGDRPKHGSEPIPGPDTGTDAVPSDRRMIVFTPVCAFLLVALLAGICPAGERILISGRTGQRVFVLSGNTFDLSWIHSVERTEWRETYSVGPSGTISLAVSEFESAGAGLPGMPNGPEVVRLEGGKMRLSGSRLFLRDLHVQLSDLSHHYLRTGSRVVDLNAVFGEGIITIQAEKTQKGGLE